MATDRSATGPTPSEVELHHAIQRLNARAWGIAVALLCSVGLFVATNVLVIKGGSNVGAHLNLLGQYFPGYRVTFVGSLIGFVYTFVLGYILGRLIGTVYNRLVM
jgi:hypothetical protein